MRLARGFTLIELMLTLGIGGMLSVAMWSSVYYQNLMFIRRLDETDIHDRAETVLQYLGTRVRQAGSGFSNDANAVGFMPIGTCTSAPGTGLAPAQSKCASLASDQGSDRLRVVSSATPYSPLSTVASAAFCNGSPTTAVNILHQNFTGSTSVTIGANAYAVVQGTCQGTTTQATDLVKIVTASTSGNTSGCSVEQTYTNTTNNTPTLVCPSGYAAGYHETQPYMDDFYLGTSTLGDGLPMLFTDLLYGTPVLRVPVGNGISRFEVRYGLDLSTPMDGQLDVCPTCVADPFAGAFSTGAKSDTYSWCREARAADQGGSCVVSDSSGTVLSTAQLINRIIAVYVKIDVMARSKRPTASGQANAAPMVQTYSGLYAVRARGTR